MLRERFKSKLLSLVTPGEEVSGGKVPGVLLAVSGGVDSMTMAHLFHSIGYNNFSVATVNFSLRGEESDGDMQLVQDWCRERGIVCYSKRFDTESYANESGISTQMAARDLRYGWFSQLCNDIGISYLAVAHNLNDKIETLFINLLRGTGINGLSSIKESSNPAGFGMTVIRPLIEFSREEILVYSDSEKVPFRHDSTNFESHYSRNKIRNQVFPVFKEINPSYLKTLEREISLFSDAAKVIEQRFDEIKGMALSILTGSMESARISIPVLRNFGNEKYWLYLLLEEWGFSPDVVNDIYNSLDSQSGKLFYSSGYELLKDRNYLIIRDISASAIDDIDLNIISVKIYDVTSGFKPLPSNIIFYLDADLTGENILFRRWRDGDRFNPLGMKGSKKISDFLTDLKRDRFSKEKRIVATTEDDRIICLLGERIDHNYRITQDTRRVLEISLNI